MKLNFEQNETQFIKISWIYGREIEKSCDKLGKIDPSWFFPSSFLPKIWYSMLNNWHFLMENSIVNKTRSRSEKNLENCGREIEKKLRTFWQTRRIEVFLATLTHEKRLSKTKWMAIFCYQIQSSIEWDWSCRNPFENLRLDVWKWRKRSSETAQRSTIHLLDNPIKTNESKNVTQLRKRRDNFLVVIRA